MKPNLFDEFNTVSAKQWKQKIQFELNGKDYNETLLWHSNEGVTIRPFYTKEDRTHLKINYNTKKINYCQSFFIDDTKVINALITKAIENNTDAIYLSADKIFDYKSVFKGIDHKKTLIYFDFSFLDSEFLIELHSYFSSKNVFFCTDSIGNLARTGNWHKNLQSDHQELAKIIDATYNSIQVNTSIYQNAGANIAQQLAYGLAHANEYLNLYGEENAGKIHFKFAIGSNYFFEIAKLRAFRILWEALLNQYNINNVTAHIFAQPTLRNKTVYNAQSNSLRTTTECMSAILGGADSIINFRHDIIHKKNNKKTQEIADKQLQALINKIGLDSPENIVNGTYYIEALTEQLAEKSLTIFKQIEKGGGFLKQLKDGIIQQKIKESSEKEELEFEKSKTPIFNLNKLEKIKTELQLYPFAKKRIVKTLIEPIIQKRLAEKIEQNRLKNE